MVTKAAEPREDGEPGEAAPESMESKKARYQEQLKQLENDQKESDDEFQELPLKIKINAMKAMTHSPIIS